MKGHLLTKKMNERFKEDVRALKEFNQSFSFLAYEGEEPKLLDITGPFTNREKYVSVKSYFKNAKAFFEKNEKEQLKEALEQLTKPDAQSYMDAEKVKVGYRESYTLKYIGDKVVFNPATAVVEVINELERMADLAGENLNRAMNALITLDQDDINEVHEVEKNINFLNHAITDYMVKINQSTLPIEDLKSIGALFHVANDIERVGDHAENIAECATSRIEGNISISKEAQLELGKMLDMVNDCYRYSVELFAHGKEEYIQKIIDLENSIDIMERELQKNHVRRLTANQCTPEAGMLFSDIISGLERIADHAVNIAFCIKENDEIS